MDWPEALRLEYERKVKPFFCDPTAEKRSKKRPASTSYMETWVNRAERYFGFLVRERGVAVESLSFTVGLDYDHLLAYFRWLFVRRNEKNTNTTKGDLDQWRHLAAALYGLRDVGDRLSRLIYENTVWEEVKDKMELAERVHADMLYVIFKALIAEAQCYERDLRKKKGRVDPEALAAHKWHEAGAFGLLLVNWLREQNVANVPAKNLRKEQDGTWYFTCKARGMKAKRNHADHGIDFWKGDEGTALLGYVLDKCVEVRPKLIARFRASNPGKPDPITFFLNQKGRKYSENAIRRMVNTVSVRYLGKDKRISPHDIRTIVPTWMFIRDGIDIVPTVQRRLDHAHMDTTEKHYLKAEKFFNARLAQLKMQEKEKQRRREERLDKLPEQIHALMTQIKDEILATMAGTAQHFDLDALAGLLVDRIVEVNRRRAGQEAGRDVDGPAGLAPTLRPRR